MTEDFFVVVEKKLVGLSTTEACTLVIYNNEKKVERI